jgi:ABC-type proline/glycine betaine transport system ATPase subunit
MSKVVVNRLYKVFGDAPDAAMRLLEQGVDKDDIFDRTGQTIGVCDASFSVEAKARSSSSWACPAPASRPWCACSTA